ncbi:MAG: sulfatase, partial [Acidobacteria bacterium]|nr:sulfatase [Acidobacteriota bacterium]
REGTRLTNFYAQPICGPSRAPLMTGCYPQRVAERGNVKNIHPVLHEKEVTIAEVLKQAGYTSAMIGKWDLAGHSNKTYAPDLLPTHQGFDLHFGTPTSNDSVSETVLLRNGEVIEKPTDFGTLTRRYTDETIRFITENKGRPFFVYLSPNMPHTVLAASEQFRGKSRRGLYGDAVEEFDWNAGRVMDTLRQLKLERNTYVLFTSDNGPWLMKKADGGSAAPLRSGKVSCWEGGLRVPCILWGPGRVPAGRVSSEFLATLDVMPTFTALAGAKAPRDRVIDGLDFTPVLHGAPGARSPRDTFYYYLWTHLQAVRNGKWKLHLPRPARPAWLRPLIDVPHIDAKDAIEITDPMLFDLETDISEQHDVADRNPDVVKRLLAVADRARADIGDYDRVGKNTRFFDPLESRPSRPVQRPEPPKA